MIYSCFIDIHNGFFGYSGNDPAEFSSAFFITFTICYRLFLRVIFNFFRAFRTASPLQLKCSPISERYASGCIETYASRSSKGSFFARRFRFLTSKLPVFAIAFFQFCIEDLPTLNTVAVSRSVCPSVRYSSTRSLNFFSYAMFFIISLLGLF